MPAHHRDVVAESVPVSAGATCGEAVTAAKLPTTGPNAIAVVRTSDGTLKDLNWAPAADVEEEPVSLFQPHVEAW